MAGKGSHSGANSSMGSKATVLRAIDELMLDGEKPLDGASVKPSRQSHAKAGLRGMQGTPALPSKQRDNASPSAGEALKILHQVQLRQAELEAQNVKLREANAAANDALERLTDLYDFAPVGYFSLDESGLILEANLTGAIMLGVERSLLVSRRFHVFVSAHSRREFGSFLGRIFAGREKQTCETHLLREEGSVFWVGLEGKVASAPTGARKSCRVAVLDIAARKRAEEAQRHILALAGTNRQLEEEIVRRQAVEAALKKSEQHSLKLLGESRRLQAELRDLSHQVMQVQEQERKRISRELHDVISQTLVGIDVHLALLLRDDGINPQNLRKKIINTQRLVQSSLQTVHEFARELRPPQLDDLGLIPALHTIIDEFTRRHGVKVGFKVFEQVETLDTDTRTVIFRVTQEALINVAKHACASLVQVRLLKVSDRVCLQIQDNGKAFAVDEVLSPKKNRRLGLIGMRERVEMVGGTFHLESKPGKGTTVRVQIPFAREETKVAPKPADPRSS